MRTTLSSCDVSCSVLRVELTSFRLPGLQLLDVDGATLVGDDAARGGFDGEQITNMLRTTKRPLAISLRELPDTASLDKVAPDARFAKSPTPASTGKIDTTMVDMVSSLTYSLGKPTSISSLDKTLGDAQPVRSPTRVSARDFREAVDDLVKSAGVSHEKARAVLQAYGFSSDLCDASSSTGPRILQLGPQTLPKRRVGLGMCCSNPSKSAAHKLPAVQQSATVAAPPRRTKVAPISFLVDDPLSIDRSTGIRELHPSTLVTMHKIARTEGAGYGLTLCSIALRVADLTREPDGSPGPAERAGVQLDSTLLRIDGQPVRDFMTVATLFSTARDQPVECLFVRNDDSPSVRGKSSPPVQSVAPSSDLRSNVSAAIESIEGTSSAARLLSVIGGQRSAPRLALQVCGSVAELAVAGSPSTWLESGLSWRAPFAALMLIVYIAAFISDSSATLSSALADAKMPSHSSPAEADAQQRTKSSISRIAGGTLACVVSLLGLLGEPVVIDYHTSIGELQWFNSSALTQSGEAIVKCVHGVVASDHGDANPLMLSWQVHVGLAQCLHSSLAESAQYQAIVSVVRLLALLQSACLVGWWVCSCYGAAQTYSLYAQWVQSRMDLSRKQLAASLEHIEAGRHSNEDIDSLVKALKDVEQRGVEGIRILGADSEADGATDAPVAYLAEVTAASAASALCWLLLLAAGAVCLSLVVRLRADDADVAIVECLLRLLITEAILAAALYMTNAIRILNSCFAGLDTALAAAQADIANVQSVRNVSDQRRDELRTMVSTSRLYAYSQLRRPRARALKPIGAIRVAHVGLRLAMFIPLGIGLREATNVLAVRLAIAMNSQLKMLPPFFRDAIISEGRDVVSNLATAGSEAAGHLATAGSNMADVVQTLAEDMEKVAGLAAATAAASARPDRDFVSPRVEGNKDAADASERSKKKKKKRKKTTDKRKKTGKQTFE